MNKNAIIAIAAAATALAAAATALVTAEMPEFAGEPGPSPQPEQPTETPAPKQKRAPKAQPPVETPPAEPVAETPPAKEEEKPGTVHTMESVKANFSELVKEGRGEEVKKLMVKYVPGSDINSVKLSAMDPKNYPAFVKDIDALKF